MKDQKVLVVGGGVAGSAAARELAGQGIEVTVVDKGRGAGGRLSYRRSAFGAFNYGAPDFQADSQTFKSEVMRWQTAGVVEPTTDARGIRYRSTGPMNIIVKHLQSGLDVRFRTRILRLLPEVEGWVAETDQGTMAPFTSVFLAVPSPQARALVPAASELAESLTRIEYAPSWVIMLHSGEAKLLADGDLVARVTEEDGGVCLHLTQSASQRYLESSQDEIVDLIRQRLDIDPAYISAHRWRYGQVTRALNVRYLTDERLQLTVCGDGFGGAGVETAYLSGLTAAQRFLEALDV